jgi:hypothetical protein
MEAHRIGTLPETELRKEARTRAITIMLVPFYELVAGHRVRNRN